MFRFWRRTKLNPVIEAWMEAERQEAACQARMAQGSNPAGDKCGGLISHGPAQPSDPQDKEPLPVPLLLRVGGPRE